MTLMDIRVKWQMFLASIFSILKYNEIMKSNELIAHMSGILNTVAVEVTL